MSKFRKKPIVIEAEQFSPERRPFPAGVEQKGGTNCYVIETLEGPHLVMPGDWIITGVKGEGYPCKPDIFEVTYEAVDGDSTSTAGRTEAMVADPTKEIMRLLELMAAHEDKIAQVNRDVAAVRAGINAVANHAQSEGDHVIVLALERINFKLERILAKIAQPSAIVPPAAG